MERITREQYEDAKRIVSEYNKQQTKELGEGKCDCGGKLVPTIEPNAYPYGDDLAYDLCQGCGRKFNIRLYGG
jgi:hypothetical protein